MKAERTYKKQLPGTIIQKVPRKINAGNMRRPNGRLTASRILRSNIYKNKRSQDKPMFADWGLGREAQHLIPYAVCRNLGIDEKLTNSACNGMMLPSGRAYVKYNPSLYYAGKSKIRAKHIKRGIAHRAYNNVVSEFLYKLQSKGIDITQNFARITFTIRLATQELGKDKAVDDITIEALKKNWNMGRTEIEQMSRKNSQNGTLSKYFDASFFQSTSTMQMKKNKNGTVIDNRPTAVFMKRKKQLVLKNNRTGLPDNLKAGIENLSGYSMDNVCVHYGSSKPTAVQAYAYTQGTDIYVAPGQERHLPHEAWHVVQQMAGRVAPTTEINGMPVNDNAALEHEADVMGAKANSY